MGLLGSQRVGLLGSQRVGLLGSQGVGLLGSQGVGVELLGAAVQLLSDGECCCAAIERWGVLLCSYCASC